jgi:hypothetical protein
MPTDDNTRNRYDIIEAAEALDESSVPQESYVPSAPAPTATQASSNQIFDANQPQ